VEVARLGVVEGVCAARCGRVVARHLIGEEGRVVLVKHRRQSSRSWVGILDVVVLGILPGCGGLVYGDIKEEGAEAGEGRSRVDGRKRGETNRVFRLATSKASSDDVVGTGLNLTASRYGLKDFCNSMLGFCAFCLHSNNKSWSATKGAEIVARSYLCSNMVVM
jgi:hypothetical protein